MARVSLGRTPADFERFLTDEAGRADLAELFARVFPGDAEKAFKDHDAGYALLAAQNPRLTLLALDLTKYIARDLAWSQRQDLRELAIQAVNHHYACAGSFESHLRYAAGVGLTMEQLAAIPYWRATSLFDDEQRLTVEYALAVVSSQVTDELFERAKARFGERGVLEMGTVVAMWSFWALILNAAQPRLS
jgi:alkylhydroperoxidase family enzyme